MKKLREISDQDFNQKAERERTENYRTREAVRMITFDGEKVALIHAKKYDYYKIPGGGIEPDEGKIAALDRELSEETGCHGKIDGEVGIIEEFKQKRKIRQISYCYLGHIIGEKSAPNFTDSETDEEFEVVWADDLDQAIQLASSARPEQYDAKFMALRDLIFLKEFKKRRQNA